MKYLAACFIALCLSIPGPFAVAREKAGLIKSASGDVRIQRGDSVSAAVNGADLMTQDTLTTGKDSYAGIIFTDGTRFTLGPDSRFKLNQYQFEPEHLAYDFSMYLEKGSGLYNSGKIGKLAPEAVSLSTPKATVGIRGTRFIIKIED